MEFLDETGRTVEDAIKKALEKMGFDQNSIDEVVYAIISKEPLLVRVIKRDENVIEIENFLKEFFEKAGIRGKFQIVPEGKNKVYINLKTDMDDILIGKDGKNLEHLNHLLSNLLRRKLKNFRFTVDVNSYMKRKEQYLINKAIAIARLAIENKMEYPLDPMERKDLKKVMEVLRKIEGIKFYRVGKGKNMKLIVAPIINE